MKWAEVQRSFPKSAKRISYRTAHYSNGAAFACGSGERLDYALDDLRVGVLRSLLIDALSADGRRASLPHSINDRLLTARWDHERHVVRIRFSTDAALTLRIPLAIWNEIAPEPDVEPADIPQASNQ